MTQADLLKILSTSTGFVELSPPELYPAVNKAYVDAQVQHKESKEKYDLTECKSCGAPYSLNSDVCEYCGRPKYIKKKKKKSWTSNERCVLISDGVEKDSYKDGNKKEIRTETFTTGSGFFRSSNYYLEYVVKNVRAVYINGCIITENEFKIIDSSFGGIRTTNGDVLHLTKKPPKDSRIMITYEKSPISRVWC